MRELRDEYPGRNSQSVPLNISIDREAVVYLRTITTPKSIGRMISRLVLEERVRREERAKAQGKLER